MEKTKIEYIISGGRMSNYNSYTKRPVISANDIEDMVKEACHDYDVYERYNNEDEARSAFSEYKAEARITAGMVGYQVDVEGYDLEKITYNYDVEEQEWVAEDADVLEYAPFDEPVYYANTYQGIKGANIYIVFDNGGGAVLHAETFNEDYTHYYDNMSQLAEDYKKIVETYGYDIKYWEGNDPDVGEDYQDLYDYGEIDDENIKSTCEIYKENTYDNRIYEKNGFDKILNSVNPDFGNNTRLFLCKVKSFVPQEKDASQEKEPAKIKKTKGKERD